MQTKPQYRALLALMLIVSVVAGIAEAQRPNFVLIIADDMGYRDPGFMGSDYHLTPHLDRLASEGMVFEQAYANAAVCAPTRAAILSGQYAARTGVYTVGGAPSADVAKTLRLLTPRNRSSLDSDLTTLPEALQQAGYATGHFGKWHLGRPTGSTDPQANGFDVSLGASRGGGTKTYFAPYGLSTLDSTADEGEYLTHRLTDEAIGFIEDHQNKPFFVMLSHYAVHTPIEPEPAVLAEVEKRPKGELHHTPEYAAMIESLDTSIGKLLDALDATGVADNTVVVFVSDNGGTRRVTSMAPLKGYKGSLNEGGIRIPAVVRYPGVVEPGSRSDTPVLLFDLYPTLLELADAQPAQGQPFDGVSWSRLLQNKTDRKLDRSLFWYVPVYGTSRRGGINNKPTAVVRHDQWKLIHDFETKTSELYNLETDLGETQDLAENQAATVRKLTRELYAWLKASDAEVPTANADYDPAKDAAASSNSQERRGNGERRRNRERNSP